MMLVAVIMTRTQGGKNKNKGQGKKFHIKDTFHVTAVNQFSVSVGVIGKEVSFN